MYNTGFHTIRDISDTFLFSRRCVSKVIHHNAATGRVQPFPVGGKERHAIDHGILQAIELYKLTQPSIEATEIQQKLIHDGVSVCRLTYQQSPQ